jgi:hypothetical protein
LIVTLILGAAAQPAPVAADSSIGLSARYDVSAQLSFKAGTLGVRSMATVKNSTAEPVDALLFNLLPARIGDLVLDEVLVDEVPAQVAVSDQTLLVGLPTALEPAASAVVTVAYSARLRTNAKDKNWMFAKINGVVTAYRWIPWLSRGVKFKRPNFGDPFVTGVSPSVRVSLTSDRKLVYATTGRRMRNDGLVQEFEAKKVRDFNFTASPHYSITKGSKNGIKIRVYTISLPPATMFKWARRSLNKFGKWVGAYPYSHFSVAQTEGGTGMEAPGLIWIPRSTKKANLPYLIAHETAHQWFYAVVGNDQAAEPYADEAPADFLARELIANRRKSKCAPDRLDGRLYDYSASCYFEVIYIQGGNYLDAYRRRVGETAFWSGMRSYYAEYKFEIGGTRQLLDALDAAASAELAGGHEQRFPSIFPVK